MNYSRLGLVGMNKKPFNQITFNLPEIDRESTREKVEENLENYRMCLLTEPVDYEPNITSSMKDIPITPSNQFHSSTEQAAINRLEEERKRKGFMNWVEKCVNRLNRNEKDIIVNLYFKYEEPMNYIVYNELGFSEAKYYRIKSDAYYKLAFIMRLQVYKEEIESA